MNFPKNINIISKRSGIPVNQVNSVIKLLKDGGTVPFISRYRKEATGSLDEVAILSIKDELKIVEQLDKRREAIIASLIKQDILTNELKKDIENAQTLIILEDIYRPYKPSRRTRASIAREQGLEPLAKQLYSQQNTFINASLYINDEKNIKTEEEAWQGAQDIVAEWINEDSAVRNLLRTFFRRNATIESKVVKKNIKEAEKFKDYFDWKEPLIKCPSHRILAIFRGVKKNFLTCHIRPDNDQTIKELKKYIIKNRRCSNIEKLKLAIEDSYKRLLMPSLETEFTNETKTRADKEAIKVFATNLKELLLAPPLGQKHILAIDPGFRTGCKVVELNSQGKLIQNFTIYPSLGSKKLNEASQLILDVCKSKKIESIAVGNGTAGRETEEFLKSLNIDIPIISVNESGASIYSASQVAREEFPDYDITVRGAVSIGRRLQDPLAELVKIDPKSIGVGQYQHDVDQKLLKESLDDVVISCVNMVGVDLNSTSLQLLTYISGLGPLIASNIIEYRDKNGAFKSRSELKKVPRLGAKSFEQAAGFLRISSGKNKLDNSSVHPESYIIVKKIAKDIKCNIEDMLEDKSLRDKININNYVTDLIGLPTLNDILNELEKPGRDPRSEFEHFSFSEEVHNISDLQQGMKLPGIVTNVTKFGAFVDIGVHQDGLVHISQLADKYVNDPNDIVKVNQKIEVTVLEIDEKLKRISLSMK